MNNRILFIVINGEIKFIQNTTMDHREWYQSLGGNMDEYENVIRGYIMDNKIIFFKANLNYDSEVIDFATKMGIPMRNQLNHPEYKICCGIDPGHDGNKWEEIITLNDKDLVGYKSEEEIEKEKQELDKRLAEASSNTAPLIEFKNNIEDPKFRKYATTFTLVLFGIAIVAKIIMVNNKTLMTDNRWNYLLIMFQSAGFILTMLGYMQKWSKTKYFGLMASVASFFLFDLIDLIVGAINLLFTIDQSYILKTVDFFKKLFEKLKKKKSTNM